MPIGVADVFLAGRVGGPHSELFAVVHLRGPARGEFEDSHQLRDFEVVLAIAVSLPLADLIVIAEEPFGPAVCGVGFDFAEELAELRSGELIEVGDLEVHGQLDFVAMRAVHLAQVCDGGLVGFGYQHGLVGVAVGELTKLAKDFVDLGKVVGVLVLDVAVAKDIVAGQVRVVVQVGVFEET